MIQYAARPSGSMALSLVATVTGRWFPDGFIGVMSNVQRFAAGEDQKLISSVEDALETMRVVEACYVSDARGGIELNSLKTK